MTPGPIVTDHAVLRYLERVYGVDVERLRRRIEQRTESGRKQGASAVVADGTRYVLSHSGRVISVTGCGKAMTSRGLRWRRRLL